MSTISISQVKAASECSYKWYLTYVEKLQRKPGETTPSTLGNLVHKGLAAAFTKLAQLQQNKRFNSTRPEKVYDTIMDEAIGIIAAWSAQNKPANKTTFAYAENSVEVIADEEFYVSWDDMVQGAVVLVENTLRSMEAVERVIPLWDDDTPMIEFAIQKDITELLDIQNEPIIFSGKVDLVYEDRLTGNKAVVDFKVRHKFTNEDSEDLAAQLAIYQHVLEKEYNTHVPMAVVYQIKSTPPATPKQNKDGSMSRAKITTDWSTYKEAVIKAGLDPTDYYNDMYPKLAGVEFFRPIIVFRLEEITRKFWNNFLQQAKHILKATEFPRVYDYACRACPFADYCRAELYNDDLEAVIAEKYVRYKTKTSEGEDSGPEIAD